MVDIAPRFAGTTNGLTQTLTALSGFVAPTVASSILKDNVSSEILKIVLIWFLIAFSTRKICPLFMRKKYFLSVKARIGT